MLKTKSGRAVNPIGIGTWDVASRFVPGRPDEKYKGTEAVKGNEAAEIAALRFSLEKGQNHIHCAELYGAFYTDEVIGRAIVDWPRQDLLLADTLWRTSVGPGSVRPTVEAMLRKLGTDYLDMLYIHYPFDNWQAAIPQIDELIDEGLVRSLGVSNFTVELMQKAMRLAKHPLAANQMQYSVTHQHEVDAAFRDFCRQHEIQIVAYRPLNRQAALTDERVQAVAAKHGVTPAQVVLAWLIQMGTWPIPKAMDAAHITDNLGALQVALDADDMATLTAS